MNPNNNLREALILGSLLHDIGKFVQRAQSNPTEKDHLHWGFEWFQRKNGLRENPLLAAVFSSTELAEIDSAILSHHDGVKYISLADALSAGMDRIQLDDEEKGDPFTDRLISIFSRVSISPKPKTGKYHKLCFLGENFLNEIMPIDEKKCSYEEYKNLLEKFNEEIKRLSFSKTSPMHVINTIYFLLWKYTWCIPSAVYKYEPDVSLFDHLKTTAAIAGCLYDYSQENPNETLSVESPAFQLIGGDISGIQSYIFNVLTQQGKIAKRLRARSLYIQLISEVAAHIIIHRFNLPLCNVISSAGGNFYILLPNLKNTEEKLKKMQREFDEWTYENFKAEIYLTLESVKVTGKQLSEYDNLLESLKKKQRIKKRQPHSLILTVGEKWNNNFVLDEVIKSDEEVCKACYKHPIKQDDLCEWCFNDEQIGRKIPKTKFIVFFRNKQQGYPIFDYSFQLWDNFNEGSSAYLVLALNDTSQVRIGFKYLATHIPTINDINCTIVEHQHEENQPVFFDCLANSSKGDSLIAYMKGDIDNLGRILREGFRKSKLSISRFASFSRMLETFFTGYLQKKLENDFKEIYTVFSGGDDFLVIGPWNKVIDFAKEIRKEFGCFCAVNPDLTFSSGISLFKPHEPIFFCVENVENQLKKSKQQEHKDRITLFEQTLAWDELDKILAEAMRVIEWLKEPAAISRAFVYNLRKYGEMSQEYEKTKKVEYLKFIPLLTYDINRNLTKEQQKETFEWVRDLLPSNEKPKGGNNLPYLKTIMDYVLTYTRR